MDFQRHHPTVFPAWEVLPMATIEGAQAIGLGDEVGSLEAGKQADLILVEVRTTTADDPLNRTSHIQTRAE